MSVISRRQRRRAARGWRLALQALLPGFLLHEAAHWLVATVVADGARLVVTPGWRVTTATVWSDDCDGVARRSMVALAPLGFAVAALPGVALVVGSVLDSGAPVAIAAACWGWLNLLVLGAPSTSDLGLILESPCETGDRRPTQA
jgi:hypothetical protein